jgi:hypothetical protein
MSRKRYAISQDIRFTDRDHMSASASPIYVLAKVYEHTHINLIIIFLFSYFLQCLFISSLRYVTLRYVTLNVSMSSKSEFLGVV